MGSIDSPAANLSKLPFELLSHIYAHISTAQTVRNLSLTCKSLYEFSRKEGWKVFTRERFPSFQALSKLRNPAEAAHALTTLSRNWDRRAFLAHYIEPSGSIVDGTTGKNVREWRPNTGQTMGYQPSIDSYEEWLGGSGKAAVGDWSSRRQVLAWSAGSELIIRMQESGSQAARAWRHSHDDDRRSRFDEYRQLTRWITWRHQGSVDGRDDITSVKLVTPHIQLPQLKGQEHILLGTASGSLDLISGELETSCLRPTISYTTNNQPIRSVDISGSTSSPLIVAGFADARIALYSLTNTTEPEPISAFSEFSGIQSQGRDPRIWTTKFLSENRIAVGLGPSTHPIMVLDVTSSGINSKPLWQIGVGRNKISDEDRVEPGVWQGKPLSSVYPISPLPPTSPGGYSPGNLFLSGWYNGGIYLHDMRSPDVCVSRYWDPSDDSAVFSLQTIGSERMIAGSARHNRMKVFDLRVAGSRAYNYLDVLQTTTAEKDSSSSAPPKDWNLFMTAQGMQPHQSRPRNQRSSPVYSLSTPSNASPTLFAGLENAVVQFDFVSIMDRHPDLLYSSAICRTGRTGEIDVKRTWNSRGRILNLAMYDQAPDQMRLMLQRGVGKYSQPAVEGAGIPNVDERWVDSKHYGFSR